MIVVAAGMPKSGTGWWFNVHNDLLVAAGRSDVREVRTRLRLENTLRHHNCLLEDTSARSLLPLLTPALWRERFVIKTHARPSWAVRLLLATGLVRATFLYRDPRDAALSAFEHGERVRREGGNSAFATLASLPSAIEFMAREVSVAEAWMALPGVLVQRYEDLVSEPQREAERLARFLELSLAADTVSAVLQRRERETRHAVDGWEHLHFNVGAVGRHRAALSPRDGDLARSLFGAFLIRAGYEP